MLSGFDISGFTSDDNSLEAAPVYVQMCSHTMTRIGRIVRHGRWWVVKSLSKDCPDRNLGKILLEKEFQILISLSHPNVVRATEILEIPGLGPSIVMEFVDGDNLDNWLKTKPSLKLRKKVAKQILSSFAYLHDCGVNHRDIKPENLMVDNNGCLKVIDFGLGDRADFAYFKRVSGTPSFAAPELIGNKEIDFDRADVYSIGKILGLLNLGFLWRYTVKKAIYPDPKRRPANARALYRMQRRLNLLHVATLLIIGLIAVTITLLLLLSNFSQPDIHTVRNIQQHNLSPDTLAETISTNNKAETDTTSAPLITQNPVSTQKKENQNFDKESESAQPDKNLTYNAPAQTVIIALLQSSYAWVYEDNAAKDENREFNFDNVRKRVDELRKLGISSGWDEADLRYFDARVSSENFRQKGSISS